MAHSRRHNGLVAHRGLWDKHTAPNSLQAIDDALLAGYGVETDLRDHRGELCIAHDPIKDQPVLLAEALKFLRRRTFTYRPKFAFNVKADGMAPLIREILNQLEPFDFFFFDMSVPQTLEFQRYDLPIAWRLSEFETLTQALNPALKPERVWLDSFYSDWWLKDAEVLEAIAQLPTTVVSPELHGRDPRQVWEIMSTLMKTHDHLNICTDHPNQLRRLMC